MENTVIKQQAFENIDIPLQFDNFSKSIIRELSGLLQEMIGLEEASGYISIVGQNIGNQMNNDYRLALNVPKLNQEQITQVLVDLKSRIVGDFYVIKADNNKIVLGNRRCPFGDYVKDRPSLCMMTSNVFGTIAAENAGYAKVALEETIATGASGCRVVVYLEPDDEAEQADGREYYKTGE